MKQKFFRTSGLSALAIAAALAFAPAASKAQVRPGEGGAEQAPPTRPVAPEDRGGGARPGGPPPTRPVAQEDRGGGARPGGPPPTRPVAAEDRGGGMQQQQMQRPEGRGRMRDMDRGAERGMDRGVDRRMDRGVTRETTRDMDRSQRMERRETMTQQPQRFERRGMSTRTQTYETRRAYRDRGYDRYRSRDRGASGFVFLGGPRIVVRGYGPGWCRGLHRGRHSAPRLGWHGGTHRGLYRCYR